MLNSFRFALSNNFSSLNSSVFFSLSTSGDKFFPNYNGKFFSSPDKLGSVMATYKRIGINFGFYAVLHVKGIGFKVFYFSKRHSLYFILGYNHIVKFRLPPSIFARVRKQYLLFFSFDKELLGKTIYQVQHLRYPDPYRGKGIRFRFQVMNFKPGKQR